MSEEEKPDNKGSLKIKLGADDSALIVRTDGSVELFSRELQGQDGNYLGDLEDLNKTFTLVLAFAASLENEQLYANLFHNLNNILHRQWNKLPTDEKQKINEIRLKHLLEKDETDGEIKSDPKSDPYQDLQSRKEWLEKWKKESEKSRKMFEDFFYDQQGEGQFPQEQEEGPRRKKKKQNPLNMMRNIDWNPYDETLKANMKSDWRLDQPPPEEN